MDWQVLCRRDCGDRWEWSTCGDTRVGFFFHGCPSCFEPSAVCPLTDAPYEELQCATEEKIQTLKSVNGVQVCHEMTSHPEVKEYLRRHNFPEPLASTGSIWCSDQQSEVEVHGRSGGSCAVCRCHLYPYGNSTFAYPLGHLVIIHEDSDVPRKYFVVLRAVEHPPRGLY